MLDRAAAVPLIVLSSIACSPGTRADAPPRAASAAPVAPADRVQLFVSYVVDEGQSSALALERSGAYELEMTGDVGDGSEDRTVCRGALPGAVNAELWRAVDGVVFAPAQRAYGSAIVAPRGKYGQQGQYSATREGGELSPEDEASARRLVPAVRAAISAAEEQAAGPGSSCTRAPER